MTTISQPVRKKLKGVTKSSFHRKNGNVKKTDSDNQPSNKKELPMKRESSSIKLKPLSKAAQEHGNNSLNLTFMHAVEECGFEEAERMQLSTDKAFIETVKTMNDNQFVSEMKRLEKLVHS